MVQLVETRDGRKMLVAKHVTIQVNRPRKVKFASKITIKKGGLTGYGWGMKKPASVRQEALRRCVRHDGYATCVQRINFLKVVADRRDNKELREVAGRDLLYLQQEYPGKNPMKPTTKKALIGATVGIPVGVGIYWLLCHFQLLGQCPTCTR
jgi:hypothetical protein